MADDLFESAITNKTYQQQQTPQTNKPKDLFEAGLLNQNDQIQSAPKDYAKTLGNYAQDTGVAATKGAANLYDFGMTPLLTDTGLVPADATMAEKANKYLPEYKNKVYGAGIEGGISALPFGGPAAAVVGGASAAGTEYLNQIRPDHPIENLAIPSILSMFTAPSIARQGMRLVRNIGEGVGLVKRDPLVQARIDQDITSGTAASVSDSDRVRRLQRSSREAIFSDINEKQKEEVGQLHAAVNRNADKLAPELSTQELGQELQSGLKGGVAASKRAFASEHGTLDHFVDPGTTEVSMAPYVNRAYAELGAERGHDIPLVGSRTSAGNEMIDRLVTDITRYGGNGNLNLKSIKRLKSELGDSLEKNVTLNLGDASVRQRTLMYGILADAEASAYAGTPFAARATALKDAESQFYRTLGEYGEKLLETGGKTAGKSAGMPINELKLGDEKLNKVLSLVQNRPELKDRYASYILRDLGLNNKNEFDTNRFLTNWQKISPEAKTTLYDDISKDMDQIALIAKHTGAGVAATNPSQTAGTLHILSEFSAWGGLIGGLAGAGYSHFGTTFGGNNKDQTKKDDDTWLSGAKGAGTGALLSGTAGTLGLARLLSNRGFVRWLATPTPINKLPLHVKALSAVAGEEPEIKSEVNEFQKHLQESLAPNQDKPRFAEGGIANDNKQSILGMLFNYPPYSYYRSPFAQPTNPNKGLDPMKAMPQPANNNSKISGYAWGGPVNDNTEGELKNTTSLIDSFMGHHMPMGGGGPGGPRQSYNHYKMEHVAEPTGNYGFIGKQTPKDIVKPEQWEPSSMWGTGFKPSQQMKNSVANKNERLSNTEWADINEFSKGYMNPNSPGWDHFAEGGLAEFMESDMGNKAILDYIFPGWQQGSISGDIPDAPWHQRIHPKTVNNNLDIESEIIPKESLTDPKFRRLDTPWKDKEEDLDMNGPVFPRTSFSDAVEGKVSSYAEGGQVKRHYTLDEMRQLAANAGFKGQSANTIAAIAMAESSGDSQAYNGKGENSYGLTQINADAHGPKAKGALNAQTAFNLAFDISRGGTNFRPWSMYTNGTFQKYLNGGSGGTMLTNNQTKQPTTPIQSASNQLESQNQPSSILQMFVGETPSTDINEEEESNQKKQKLAQSHIDEVPWADPLTKYAIKGIWMNSNL